MNRASRRTFQEILTAVAPLNAVVLEARARRAIDLAAAYPQMAPRLAVIEDRLLSQLSKVLHQLLGSATDTKTDPTPSDKSVEMVSVKMDEQT